jgi:hypothetical protein
MQKTGAMKPAAISLLCLGTLACSSSASRVTSSPDAGLDRDATGTAPRDAGARDAETKRDVATIEAPKLVDARAPDAAPSVPGLDASPAAWTWVDVPGAKCADGSATGFAINPAPSPSNDTLIFLEGGGACWNGTTCWGPVSTGFYVQTGYDELAFQTDPQVAAIYLLDRANTNNPFVGKNIVYVPYCTGDVFAGNRETSLDYLGVSHDTHFVGYENVSLFLDYVNSTFPSTNRVWLAGDSAGGFGAALNFEHVQAAMPNARVDVIDDSGQPIEPAAGLWSTWTTAWNVQFPPGCTGCDTSVGAFADYYRMKYPSHRFGLISYQYDTVISPFMEISVTQFNTELYALAAHMDATWPNGHYFIVPGASHVGLLVPSAALMTWVNELVNDDASWASSKP